MGEISPKATSFISFHFILLPAASQSDIGALPQAPADVLETIAY
jgi:hypothetical protein